MTSTGAKRRKDEEVKVQWAVRLFPRRRDLASLAATIMSTIDEYGYLPVWGWHRYVKCPKYSRSARRTTMERLLEAGYLERRAAFIGRYEKPVYVRSENRLDQLEATNIDLGCYRQRFPWWTRRGILSIPRGIEPLPQVPDKGTRVHPPPRNPGSATSRDEPPRPGRHITVASTSRRIHRHREDRGSDQTGVGASAPSGPSAHTQGDEDARGIEGKEQLDPIFTRLANRTHTTPEQASINAAKWGEETGMSAIAAARAYLMEAESRGEDTDGV